MCFILSKNKEKIKKKSHERYQNLNEEEKNRKREYGRKRYKNISKTQKQRLAKYKKRYEMRKNNRKVVQ